MDKFAQRCLINSLRQQNVHVLRIADLLLQSSNTDFEGYRAVIALLRPNVYTTAQQRGEIQEHTHQGTRYQTWTREGVTYVLVLSQSVQNSFETPEDWNTIYNLYVATLATAVKSTDYELAKGVPNAVAIAVKPDIKRIHQLERQIAQLTHGKVSEG